MIKEKLEPEETRMISITQEEYSRMVRDNQVMLSMLDRLMDIAVQDGKFTEAYAPHKGLLMGACELIDNIKNPIVQIADRKTGMTPYEKMLSNSSRSKTSFMGVPVIVHPDMPEGQLWVNNHQFEVLVDKRNEEKNKKKKPNRG